MPRYWLAIGSRENWLTAFQHGNTWGLRSSRGSLWNRISEGDILLFYVTSDIRGVVGYGRIRGRFRQDEPLWPLELLENRVIWPFRIEFDVEACLAPAQWRSSKIRPGLERTGLRGGFQELGAEMGQALVDSLTPASQKEINLVKAGARHPETSRPQEHPSSIHDQLKATVMEIGKLQKFLAEAEYKLDGEKLDVVWRRVERSVPRYVFEIHVSGDIYHAMAKLKHAFDLWNSYIFLIASAEQKPKVEQLLSGTFHEIQNTLKFLPLDKVAELYQRKKGYHEFEQQLGII